MTTVEKVEQELRVVGERLSDPPSDVDELISLLDLIETLLSKVVQSPKGAINEAMTLLRKGLVADKVFRNSDKDVRVALASCLSEILRITAPEAPYNDEKMKELLQLIVSTFEDLDDKSSRSYAKRIIILETTARVRSSVVMLDLECDALIVDMVHSFFKTIRDYHPEDVLSSMMSIITLVLDESENLSPQLLSPILACLRHDNRGALPIAQRLAANVLSKCASKVKPFLLKAVESLGDSLDDYSNVVVSICQYKCDDVEQEKVPNNDQVMVPTETASVEADNMNEESPESEISNDGTREEKDIGESSEPKEADGLGNTEINGLETEHTELDKTSLASGEEPTEHTALDKASLASGDSPTEHKGLDKASGDEPTEHTELDKTSLASGEEATEHTGLDKASLASGDEPTEHIQLDKASLASGDEPTEHTGLDKPSPASGDEPTDTGLDKTYLASGDEPTEHTELGKASLASGDEPTEHTGLDKAPLVSGDEPTEPLPVQKDHANDLPVSAIENPSDEKLAVASENGEETNADQEQPVSPVKEAKQADEEMTEASDLKNEYATPGDVGEKKKNKKRTEPHTDSNANTLKRSRRTVERYTDPGTWRSYNRLQKRPRIESRDLTPPPIDKEYDEDLIGAKIRVWWPLDRCLYPGVVDSYDSSQKKHQVLYDDGDSELLNLKEERWKFEADVTEEEKKFNYGRNSDATPERAEKRAKTNSNRESSKKGKKNNENSAKTAKSSSSSAQRSGKTSKGAAENPNIRNEEKEREAEKEMVTQEAASNSKNKEKSGSVGGKIVAAASRLTLKSVSNIEKSDKKTPKSAKSTEKKKSNNKNTAAVHDDLSSSDDESKPLASYLKKLPGAMKLKLKIKMTQSGDSGSKEKK